MRWRWWIGQWMAIAQIRCDPARSWERSSWRTNEQQRSSHRLVGSAEECDEDERKASEMYESDVDREEIDCIHNFGPIGWKSAHGLRHRSAARRPQIYAMLNLARLTAADGARASVSETLKRVQQPRWASPLCLGPKASERAANQHSTQRPIRFALPIDLGSRPPLGIILAAPLCFRCGPARPIRL